MEPLHIRRGNRRLLQFTSVASSHANPEKVEALPIAHGPKECNHDPISPGSSNRAASRLKSANLLPKIGRAAEYSPRIFGKTNPRTFALK
jgi:hypothetical protein